MFKTMSRRLYRRYYYYRPENINTTFTNGFRLLFESSPVVLKLWTVNMTKRK